MVTCGVLCGGLQLATTTGILVAQLVNYGARLTCSPILLAHDSHARPLRGSGFQGFMV